MEFPILIQISNQLHDAVEYVRIGSTEEWIQYWQNERENVDQTDIFKFMED